MMAIFDTAWWRNKAVLSASCLSLRKSTLCLTASFMAVLVSGAGAQSASSGYGCLSFHEVNATVTPEEALRLGAPRGYKIYPQLRDPSDQLVLRETPIISSGEILEADGTFDPQSHRSVVTVRFNPDAAGRLGAFTTTNVGRQLAIVLDGRVISSAVIREPIVDGTMHIDRKFASIAETQHLVNFLSLRSCQHRN